MKNSNFLFLYCFSTVTIGSCCKEKISGEPTPIGSITVDMIATPKALRTQEAVLGNLICDALKADAVQKGKFADFAIINGGAIRYNANLHPNGIYPAGVFTSSKRNIFHLI